MRASILHYNLGFRRFGWSLTGVLFALCVASIGCSPGIRWRGYTFEPVYAESRRNDKLTFVYFRNWAVTDCTQFEENVLKTPEVRQALNSDGVFYCAVLDFLWDRPMADRWGIESPPGVVILTPDGRVLAHLSGKISAEALLDAIQSAKSEFLAATQPASVP